MNWSGLSLKYKILLPISVVWLVLFVALSFIFHDITKETIYQEYKSKAIAVVKPLSTRLKTTISDKDMFLFKLVDTPEEAVIEIDKFYHNYLLQPNF